MMYTLQLASDTLLFLLPFERIPSMELAGISVRLSSVIILLFALIGIPYLLYRRKLMPFSAIDKSLLIYIATVFLSVPFALHLNRSIVVAGLIVFVAIGYLLISRAYRPAFSFDRITNVIIAAGLVTACFGIFQYFGDALGLPQSLTGLIDRYTSQIFGFPRVQSVGLEPLYYANYLLLPMFIVLIRLFIQPWRWGDAGAWLLFIWVFVLALSRGAYIGFIVGLVVLMIALALKKMINWRKIAGIVAITFLSFGLAYLSIRVVSGPRGLQNFGSHAIVSQGAQEEASASPRIERFKEAVVLFRQHPIIGVGIGGFGAASKFDRQPDGGYEIVNNQYLETLAETGIVGFLALMTVGLTLLTLLIRQIKQSEDAAVPIIFLASFVAIATQYNFYSTIYVLHIWALFGLIDAYLFSKEK